VKNADFLFAFLGSQILVGNGGYWFLSKIGVLLMHEIVLKKHSGFEAIVRLEIPLQKQVIFLACV
jgi:hypothetical protein